CAGSAHAGVEPLAAGTDAISAGSARVALVVVSDALRPGPGTGFEARCGAGAAALVLAVDGPVTATIGARVTRTRPFLDRYRGDGEVDNRDMYDARLFREEIFLPVVRDVAETLAAFDVRAWSLPDPDGRLGAVLARDVGAPITPSSTIYGAIGDAGASAALARHGRVHTFVVNQTMPAPFVAPLPIVVLDMDDGARLMLQAIGDGTDIEIGRHVALVLRKYAHERGVPVYGFKAQPKKEVVS